MADVSLKNVQGVFTPEDIKRLDQISNDAINNAKLKSQTLDQDAFMKILATQLKYQDPLSPMKDQEFIGQMAQFNSLNAMNNLVELTQDNSVLNQDMVTIMAMMSVGIDKLVAKLVPDEGDTDTEGDTSVDGGTDVEGGTDVDGGTDTTDPTEPTDPADPVTEALASSLSSDTLAQIAEIASGLKNTNEALKAYANI